jgi:hypothetical protein
MKGVKRGANESRDWGRKEMGRKGGSNRVWAGLKI